jgi:MSHA pilin protein MshC
MRGKRSIGRSSRSSTTGFTIVELVVLISIIGIVAAVAAPRFLAMSDLRAVQSHRQALRDLRFAQRQAASSGCPVQVDFDGSGYALTQRTQCRTGPFTRSLTDPSTGQTPYVVGLSDGLTVTSTVDPLIFDSLGRATNSGGVVGDVDLLVGTRAIEAIGESGLVRVP